MYLVQPTESEPDSDISNHLADAVQTINPTTILCKSLEDLLRDDQPLDITATATPAKPRRFRFVRCDQLTKYQLLCIEEFDNLSHVKYTAISYVWRGNTVEPGDVKGKFTVKGAEDADPIGIDVLNHACSAALLQGYSHLWLDRLSIIQTSDEDKKWQIKQMHSVYQSCSLCIVLAGGVQRLVRLDEETSWIHRGWTLQEAIAPPAVSVLFAWKLGPGEGSAGDIIGVEVKEVVHRESAMAPLSLVIDACVTGSMSFTGPSQKCMVDAKMFSSYPTNYSYNDVPFWRPQRKLMTPNVAALAVITNTDLESDAKEYAIWQSALMRTSSRPVDMVFSIMGLFGVTLDTSSFHKNDRIGATIALAREILSRGGRASWLGASFRLDPCKEISTFPMFPQTRVAGKALVSTKEGVKEVSEFMASEYPYAQALLPMPQGTMDLDGYLTFKSKAVELLGVEDNGNVYRDAVTTTSVQFAAMDGSVWYPRTQTLPRNTDSEPFIPRVFAVLLGWFNGYYPGATPAHDANNIRAMLVEEHSSEKFHVRSYFSLSMKLRQQVLAWPEHSFCVGGPNERKEGNGDEEELHESVVTVEKLRLPTSSAVWEPTLQDQTARLARWAVPQQVLERHLGEAGRL